MLVFRGEGFNYYLMIAVATQATRSVSLDHLPFGWFDVALVALLVFGLFRGRRNGMTKEFAHVTMGCDRSRVRAGL